MFVLVGPRSRTGKWWRNEGCVLEQIDIYLCCGVGGRTDEGGYRWLIVVEIGFNTCPDPEDVMDLLGPNVLTPKVSDTKPLTPKGNTDGDLVQHGRTR